MLQALLAIGLGLALLVWSAGRFVEGAACLARHIGAPPLLIGMLVVGFGTSLPEMVVSLLASLQGNPGIALGNAYGSNITNISLVLGLTALISPIAVNSLVVRKELPILTLVTLLAASQLLDGEITRADAMLLLGVFLGLMAWTIREGLRKKDDALGNEIARELEGKVMPAGRSVFWVLVGLAVLVASSRLLVWGAVTIAQGLGVADMVIGLTVVALGTSLPELASSLVATRRGEHDLALGNVLGSNLFNTLAVVGIAGAIHPMALAPEVFDRDILVMIGLTLSLFVVAFGFRGPGVINRFEGAALLACYLGYTSYLVSTQLAG